MDLDKISQKTEQRYTKRYNKLGKHIRTLGWGSQRQQNYRFEQALQFVDSNKIVLDIGCGFGDLLAFMEKQSIQYNQYIGWDINDNFVNEAQKTNEGKANCRFEVKDILKDCSAKADSDIAIMLGLLNWKFDSAEENYKFSELMIKNAFSYVKECLIVDFLSTNLSKDYPQEDFVFYHNPIKMLDFAFTLSNNVVIKHDYAPIPQKEFMLVIYK